MAQIVLIQPKVGDWDEVRSHPSLPLGLLAASRLVVKEFDTVLIDTRIEDDWKKAVITELSKKPLCVGITSMTGRQIGYALQISRFVKSISNTPIIWGGIHGSLLPESTLENEFIDILVIGEGEETFLEVARSLAKKESLKGIQGVWYKEGLEVIKNQARPFINLDSFPYLPLELIDVKKYLPIFKGRRTFYIETSRGCPNRCGFCYNAAYNKNSWRAYSPPRVINELKFLINNYSARSFYTVDDNFFVDLKRARSIAEMIVDEKLDIYWEAQGISINSALKMDDSYLRLLVSSGLKKVHFGVESGSEKILKKINKSLKTEDVVKVNKAWSKYNIVLQYNFMCGFPGETLDDIKVSKDLIFKLMKENHHALISPLCPYTPYPGTALYDEALSGGFIRKKSLQEWQEADYGDNLWESAPRKKLLSSLFFASMFLDKHRSKDMVSSFLLKAVIELYRPIAKFRIRHLFFRLMPELKIKELFFK